MLYIWVLNLFDGGIIFGTDLECMDIIIHWNIIITLLILVYFIQMRGESLEHLQKVGYSPLVDPTQFTFLWVVLGAIGIMFSMTFFGYEVTVDPKKRNFFVELLLVLASALTLGFGFFFLFLSSGL